MTMAPVSPAGGGRGSQAAVEFRWAWEWFFLVVGSLLQELIYRDARFANAYRNSFANRLGEGVSRISERQFLDWLENRCAIYAAGDETRILELQMLADEMAMFAQSMTPTSIADNLAALEGFRIASQGETRPFEAHSGEDLKEKAEVAEVIKGSTEKFVGKIIKTSMSAVRRWVTGEKKEVNHETADAVTSVINEGLKIFGVIGKVAAVVG